MAGFPENSITVTRHELIGFDQLGRPFTRDKDTRSFSTQREALSWVIEAEENRHDLFIPFTEGQKIELKLEGPIYKHQEEILMVDVVGLRRGMSPRMIEGHHAVSTNYEDSIYLIVKVGHYYDHPLIDRGVAWIHPRKNRLGAELHFTLKPYHGTLEDLIKGVERVKSRADAVFEDILRGTTDAGLVYTGTEQ